MVAVRRQLVSDAVRRTHTFGGGNRKVGITVHETANRSKGANATAHANLQSRGGTAASWHWTVDDKEAVQSYDHDWRLFHAGTGSAGDGDDTVSIEICVNEGIDQALAYRNAIELIQHLWRIDGGLRRQLFQHNHWSGKNCPTILRAGTIMTWAQFVAASFGVPAEQPPVVVPPATEAPLGGTLAVDVGIGAPVIVERIDLRNAKNATVRTKHVDNMQGLLVAAGHKLVVDCNGGPASRAALGAFQVATNTGDGKGNADYVCGPSTWRALIQY